MRKYAILKEPVPANSYGDLVRKIMIYETKKEGVSLFLFLSTHEYGMGSFDYWFGDLESAEECALEEFGIKDEDWILIDDPLPHCQHDCIHPIRIKGRDKGNPTWDELEIYDGTNWVEFIPPKV